MASHNKYATLTGEALEQHLSKYLISSWSYSAVSCFSRNEAEFEKSYVYRERSRSSASSVAGSAYHKSLEDYFKKMMLGEPEPSLVEMETTAYQFIDDVPANEWKIQKSTPSIESCKTEATKAVTALLESFYREKSMYSDEIEEVLGVEQRIETWLTINGVDIPIPCHMVLDLVVRTKSGKTVIIDHKSKRAYTDEAILALTRGSQCMTYVLGYETEFDSVKIDEVWFIENKISTNKDRTPQMRKYAIVMDDDTRAYYSSILYEPVKRMVGAVSDPDYVYVQNYGDNMSDVAELMEFKTRTLISDIEDFNVPTDKKELIAKRLKKVKDSSRKMISPKAITAFRKHAASFITYDYSIADMDNKQKIEHVLRTFGCLTQVAHEIIGFSSNTYLLEVSAGVKLSDIQRYRLDLASALNVSDVRISNSLVMYEGKSYLSLEANKKRTETLMWDPALLEGRRIPLGLDNYRNTIVWDLDNSSTPHMLVCGSSGSGKSVLVRSVIEYSKLAGIEKIYVSDPKWEFTNVAGIKTFNDTYDIEVFLNSLVDTMNYRIENGIVEPTLVVIDEYADLKDGSRTQRQLDEGERLLEVNIKRLLQKGRSCGIRMLIATQRASVKIIPGDLKANAAVRVCMRMPEKKSSIVVLDESGAEMLSGGGDALIVSPEYMNQSRRFQGFFFQE